MEPHPVYAGADFNAPPSPKAATPSVISPIQQAATSGYTKAMHALSEVEEDAYNRMEYTLDQERKLYMAETMTNIEADSLRRLSLPNGHELAFYDEMGRFRDSYFRDYVSSQKARFNGLEQGYIKPDSITAAKADILKLKQKISDNLSLKIAANLSTRAKDATLKLANFQADQGLFADAIATIQGADPAAFSDLEKDSLVLDFERKQLLNNAQNAVNSNDAQAYYALRYDPQTAKKLTPQQFRQLQNLEKNFLDTDGMAGDDDFFPDFREEGSENAPTRSPKASQTVGLPLGVTDDLVRLFDDWNGDFKDGEAQRQAVDALDKFAARFITPNMSIQDEALLSNIAHHFKIDQSTLSAIKEKYTSLFGSHKNFNYKKSLKNINPNFFIPKTLQNQLKSAQQQAARLAAVDTSTLGKRARQQHKDAVSKATLALSSAKVQAEESKERIIASINKKYADWLISQTPEQRKALTENQQKMKLYDIVDNTMDEVNKGQYAQDDEWDFSNTADYRLTQQENAAEETARKDALSNRQQLNDETTQTDAARVNDAVESERATAAQSSIPPGFVSLSSDIQAALALDNSANESFLAVPAGHSLAGSYLTIKHKGRTRRIPCREQKNISAPTLSLRARTNFGMDENSRFDLLYNSSGKAIFSSTAVPAQDTNLYQIILNHEVSGKTIGVESLISADGGGAWEIAGINVASHPQESSKLRDMIRSGATQDQLKQEIFAYYKQFTQQVADIVNPIVNSKGIELFMRDCCFNHGPGAINRVLRRAINAPDNADLAKSLQTYIDTHGKTALLNALSATRAGYYAGIVAHNHSKSVFLKGWRNRNRNITQAARAMLDQPSTSSSL